jgi:uncharacterized protein YjiS (DUF1127 family)
MTTIDFNDVPAPERVRFSLVDWLRAAFTTWRARAHHRRAMREVSELDAHLLRDIGLSWEDVDRGILGKQRSIWLNPLSDDDR